MKVKELVALLQAQDQEAAVGASMSSLNGWVQEIDSVILTEGGIVCVNQGELVIVTDEVGFAKTV